MSRWPPPSNTPRQTSQGRVLITSGSSIIFLKTTFKLRGRWREGVRVHQTKAWPHTKAVHTPGPGVESRPLFLLSPCPLGKPGSGSNSPSSSHSCSEKEWRKGAEIWVAENDNPAPPGTTAFSPRPDAASRSGSLQHQSCHHTPGHPHMHVETSSCSGEGRVVQLQVGWRAWDTTEQPEAWRIWSMPHGAH